MGSRRLPSADDVVVYIDGTFDLFNIKHALNLQRAKELGTFLVVGVHDGKGAYDELLDAGALRIVKRTEGVSTTSLVERLLRLTDPEKSDEVLSDVGHRALFVSTRRIAEFSSRRLPSADDVVV